MCCILETNNEIIFLKYEITSEVIENRLTNRRQSDDGQRGDGGLGQWGEGLRSTN